MTDITIFPTYLEYKKDNTPTYLGIMPELASRNIPTYMNVGINTRRPTTITEKNPHTSRLAGQVPYPRFTHTQYPIEKETTLRNQRYGLQHGADQAIYVPASNSDLYNDSYLPIFSGAFAISPVPSYTKVDGLSTSQNKYVLEHPNNSFLFHNNTRKL